MSSCIEKLHLLTRRCGMSFLYTVDKLQCVLYCTKQTTDLPYSFKTKGYKINHSIMTYLVLNSFGKTGFTHLQIGLQTNGRAQVTLKCIKIIQKDNETTEWDIATQYIGMYWLKDTHSVASCSQNSVVSEIQGLKHSGGVMNGSYSA